jgi:hypothetical protein
MGARHRAPAAIIGTPLLEAAMWMKQAQMEAHPKFAKYVKESMPTCKTVPKIVKALQKFGGLSEADAIQALSWGHAPLVRVVDLWDKTAWKSLGNGGFDPSKPGEIQIAQHRVEQFETPGAGGTDTNAAGALVYIVGATLLHELCHWGLHKVGKAEVGEAGKRFEEAVYGKQIN